MTAHALPAKLLGGLLLISGGTLPAQADNHSMLDRYRWTHRPLVIVAPDRAHTGYQCLQRVLSARHAALQDRDMPIIRVLGQTVAIEPAPDPNTIPSADALRGRLRVSPSDARMILIGKDGGQKATAPIAPDADRDTLGRQLAEFFARIDGMPMRQQEIRTKRQQGQPVTPAYPDAP